MKKIIVLIVTIILFTSCEENTAYKETLNDPDLFRASVKNLSDVIVYDIFSPPVASRIYMYPSVAAYSVMQNQFPEKYHSLEGQLKGFHDIPKPESKDINYHLAALHAFTEVGKKLIFSEDKVLKHQDSLYMNLKDEGIPNKMFKASTAYGEIVADHIMNWAKKDLYNQTRNYPKYTILQEDQYWKPTPPDYMDGIEPHWNKIRVLVIDSARQFSPERYPKFSMDKKSDFYKELREVYDVSERIKKDEENSEEVAIAKFWDCNPYVSHHRGHAMFATKKITPGGHWIGITSIASKKANSTFDETINAYTNVSISLFDAFISCWDEKWKTLVVRPETIINQYIDEEWTPLLQTPPFPEYTSGHSVISRAAAVTLTKLYGNNFSFSDDTELEYGLPIREFSSFLQASEEAAISRLYGGIHYRMAIDEGVSQGQKVGDYIMGKLKTIKPKETVAMTKNQ